MDVSELDYELPPELIAQSPVEPRDAARLPGVRPAPPRGARTAGSTSCPSLLRAGDLLVRNDTRVLAARTHFRRATGGDIEVLFLEARAAERHGQDGAATWEALVRGRPREGETLTSGEPMAAGRSPPGAAGGRALARAQPGARAGAGAARAPSGRRRCRRTSRRGWPTRNAIRRCSPPHPGSAAAPTAGLHFTAGLERAAVCRRRGDPRRHAARGSGHLQAAGTRDAGGPASAQRGLCRARRCA